VRAYQAEQAAAAARKQLKVQLLAQLLLTEPHVCNEYLLEVDK
jgi:hypothetical protein